MEPPMTVKELSEYLRLDRMTIYKMLKDGSIPASRIGHQWRFFREDINDWMRSRRIGHRTAVLIVEKDPTVRALLDSELAEQSVEVVMAESVENVLSYVSHREFDMVFLDLEESAVQLFKDIRELDRTLPVAIVADGADASLVDQVMEIGTFTLVRRPTSAKDVENVLSSLPLRNDTRHGSIPYIPLKG